MAAVPDERADGARALTEEDRGAVRDGLARLLDSEVSEEKLRAGMKAARGYDEGLWRRLGAMGLLGIAVAPTHGGSGGGAVDVEMVAAELGRVLAPVPFVASAVVGGYLIERMVDTGSGDDAAAALLPALIDGSATLAIGGDAGVVPLRDRAHRVRFDRSDGGSATLSGELGLVLDGAHADATLIAVETPEGTTAGLVRAGAGVATEPQQANDPALRPARLRFDRAPAVMLDGLTPDTLEAARLRGVAALAAMQAGAARAIFGITVDYLKIRYQFGRPIGSFQALKHIAADLLVEVESATSAAHGAALALDYPDDAEPGRAVALAGFICADAFRTVSAEAIQLHGGIAYTEEHVAHLYWRRARAMAAMFGGADAHREAYLTHRETIA